MARPRTTKKTTQKAQTQRTNRAQEQRDAEPVHEYTGGFNSDGTLLDAPDPRRGYVQRWVRTKLNGVDDPANLVRRMNQGWRPRPADTLPKGAFAPTINHGDYGNVVGTHDMLLMERDEEIHQRYEEQTKQATRNLEQSVKSNLGKVHQNEPGFTRPEMSVQTSVRKGRPVAVAEDD